jgi:Trypsin-co-occurring domain 1
MTDTVKIFADNENPVVVKGSLPTLHELGAHIHDVSADVLEQNLSALMQRVETIINGAAGKLKQLKVEEVKVAVAVNGSGEFSLLGLTKASAELEATFEITLKPK